MASRCRRRGRVIAPTPTESIPITSTPMPTEILLRVTQGEINQLGFLVNRIRTADDGHTLGRNRLHYETRLTLLKGYALQLAELIVSILPPNDPTTS